MHRTYEWLKTPRYTYGRLFELALTYKWLRQPPFWPLKYGQLCTPDDETVNNVILSVNTNAPKGDKTLPTMNAVSGEGRLHSQAAQVTQEVGRQAHSELLTDPHVRIL